MTAALTFDPVTKHLPPGRTRLTFDEAHRQLVGAKAFAASTTRPALWRGLQDYLVGFGALSIRYGSRLTADPLVHFLWLGGSFASAEINPQNIDVTVCVDAENRSRLRGVAGGGWMNEAFSRAKILAEFGVSPLEMQYRRVASVFQMQQLEDVDRLYLQTRGAWDDWWQRCRVPGEGSPSGASADVRRGYVEVTL